MLEPTNSIWPRWSEETVPSVVSQNRGRTAPTAERTPVSKPHILTPAWGRRATRVTRAFESRRAITGRPAKPLPVTCSPGDALLHVKALQAPPVCIVGVKPAELIIAVPSMMAQSALSDRSIFMTARGYAICSFLNHPSSRTGEAGPDEFSQLFLSHARSSCRTGDAVRERSCRTRCCAATDFRAQICAPWETARRCLRCGARRVQEVDSAHSS